MIEIRHLRSLIAIAETGKLAAAAERVFLTQSALSHQIRALEEHYGVTLLHRQRSGLQFTAAGERLLKLAHQVVDEVMAVERDLARLRGDVGGQLRIALECHTCFEWLMPVMDEFRRRWPEVELDLVAGFHAEPLDLLREGRAELVIGGAPGRSRDWVSRPLFRFEILVVLPNEHRLRQRPYLEPADFAGETLITYPVPEERIDLIRECLRPAGIAFERRMTELTIAIVQLVASRRGVAALPNWGVKSYLDYDYVIGKPIGAAGLWSTLHATVPKTVAEKPYFSDLVDIIATTCARRLDGIELLTTNG